MGGMWFVVGPNMSMLWNGGVPATGAAIGDNGTRVLEWIGFFYGTGALITLLASYGLGFLAALPVTGEAVPAGTGAAAPAAPAPPGGCVFEAGRRGSSCGAVASPPDSSETAPY